MGFSRQEYWTGLPCPPPGELPNPGIKPKCTASHALVRGFFTTSTTWEALKLPIIPNFYLVITIPHLFLTVKFYFNSLLFLWFRKSMQVWLQTPQLHQISTAKMPVTSMLLNLVNTIPLASFLTAWKYVIQLTVLFFLGILCFQCSSLSWLTHLHLTTEFSLLSSSTLLIHMLQSTPIPSIVARLINPKLSSTLIFPTVYLTSPFVCFRGSSKQISHTDLIIFPPK